MKKTLRGLRNLGKLFAEHGMTGFDFVSMNIDYAGRACFLFSSKIPERIDRMFVNTVANAEYAALIVTPSWESGAVEKVEKLDFGRHAMNFHFMRPVPDGTFLLLGSRCVYSKKNGPEKNAVFTDRAGNVLRALTFGDGIEDCIVRADGTIITSYFDEGVLGNYGWDDPIGSSGLCAWTPDGRISTTLMILLTRPGMIIQKTPARTTRINATDRTVPTPLEMPISCFSFISPRFSRLYVPRTVAL